MLTNNIEGVGHKTASVVLSQIFGVPSFAVDTHVHRLANRWEISKDQKNVNKVQADLMEFFPKNNWNRLHLQMIYFGREYCPAKMHENSKCPICSWVKKGDYHFDSASFKVAKKEEDASSASFTPVKKAKGLVYYNDRIDELEVSPFLAHNSPSKGIPLVMDESKQTISTKFNIMAEFEGEAKDEDKIKAKKRKINDKDVKIELMSEETIVTVNTMTVGQEYDFIYNTTQSQGRVEKITAKTITIDGFRYMKTKLTNIREKNMKEKKTKKSRST